MKNINVDNTSLTANKRYTFTSEDLVAGGATIAVQNILGFESLDTSSGQIVLIGNIGEEFAELRRTSNSSSPSSSYKWIYLRDTLKFDHPQDTKVTIIDWNRIELSHAATVTGSKSTLKAYPVEIDPAHLETVIPDTTQSSGFYFTRFNETVGNTNSDYSDAIPFAGYDDNMVFSIKQRALDQLGESIDGAVITHDFLNQCLWEARREYHRSPGKRPFRRKYNVAIGAVLTGSFRIELPADLERSYGDENLYGVRIGTGDNLARYTKKEWDFDWQNKPRSSLAVPYTVGISTSIWLANGRDFSGSANIVVEGTTIGLSRITGSNNSFTIITHGDWSASGGSDAYENVSLGLPDHYAVWADPEGSAYIYFNRAFETAQVGKNIFADYYRTLVAYNSDADTLDEPEYDAYVYYLKAKIKHRKNKGESDITKDADYQLWLQKKASALANENLQTPVEIRPDIDHLDIPW